MIPEGTQKTRDLIDAIVTASQKQHAVEQKDGSITYEQQIDPDTIWTKTSHVNSNYFGKGIFELKEWERLASIAKNAMCIERASIIAEEILGLGESVRRTYDAKSAETIGINQDSAQTNVLGMIGKNKQERVYQLKDGAKKSMFDSILGRDVEREED